MNDENLIQNKQTTPEERRENARKAGKASARSRKAKADLRKAMQALLDGTYKNADGTSMTGHEAIASTILHEALNADSKNWGKANDYIMQMTNSLKSDEERQMLKAQAALIQAKADTIKKISEKSDGKLADLIAGLKEDDIHTETASTNEAVAEEQAETN